MPPKKGKGKQGQKGKGIKDFARGVVNFGRKVVNVAKPANDLLRETRIISRGADLYGNLSGNEGAKNFAKNARQWGYGTMQVQPVKTKPVKMGGKGRGKPAGGKVLFQ